MTRNGSASRPEFQRELASEALSARLDAFRRRCDELTALHAGYPYNLAYDYTPLLPFFQYTINNLGDPYVNGNYGIHSREFERECLAWFARLYNLEDHWGYVTSCGTEGNLYGIFLGRERYPDAALYFSRDTHYSVLKAARLYQIAPVAIDSQSNGEIDYADLEAQVARRGSRPAIVNVNLGTTLTGAVDRIDRVVAILERVGVPFHLHCDGALGGLLLPYIPGSPAIDFAEYPIDSIAVSGHKFIGSPIPCGIVLARRAQVRQIETTIEYIGSTDTTIMGSRQGLAALFLWFAINSRADRFAEEVATCVGNAEYLRDGLAELGLDPLLNAFSNTVVFRKPAADVCRTWQLATQGDLAHVVVMQNIGRDKLDALLEDLSTARDSQPRVAVS